MYFDTIILDFPFFLLSDLTFTRDFMLDYFMFPYTLSKYSVYPHYKSYSIFSNYFLSCYLSSLVFNCLFTEFFFWSLKLPLFDYLFFFLILRLFLLLFFISFSFFYLEIDVIYFSNVIFLRWLLLVFVHYYV